MLIELVIVADLSSYKQYNLVVNPLALDLYYLQAGLGVVLIHLILGLLFVISLIILCVGDGIYFGNNT